MIKPEVLDAMVAAGCTAAQIAAAVKADQASSSGATRQARYRARKASQSDERDVTPVTVTEVVSPKKETSPTPPKEKTTPSTSEDKSSSITPRSALETVLDAERAGALIEHRKRIGKPLTAHAAKLIAAKLAQWPDPNFAADEMISNGWQGFKPEWLERRIAPQNQATAPPKKTTHASMWTDEAIAFGIIDEPDSTQDRRLDARLARGQDQGSNFARRITVS